jgi:hypothetical protein
MTENDMTSLLLQLADFGITGIKVHYDGGGDSGAIETIAYTKDILSSNEDEAFETVDDLDVWGYGGYKLIDLDSTLYSDFEAFVTGELLDDVEDWWNNEGGYGYVSVLIPSGHYKIENNIRTVITDDYYHSGNLIQKTLK